ncbi:Suppressor of kinetochore protein 1 [Pichia kudriavzevii]|uniref:Suppressor of kinetochore protein 1 n=1 Tax=Pichia kudriavzevii TaxID=4909 RepID=A0A1V2LTM7_PICKU|nr:Suppressor of kinetochore protein 1 [Pichia kudriavzevii]
MAADKTIVIITSDNDRFTVERKVAEKSLVIKNMLKNLLPVEGEDDSDSDEDDSNNIIEVPTQNVRSATFNIVNDFTPEEEAAIRRENEWAEDR